MRSEVLLRRNLDFWQHPTAANFTLRLVWIDKYQKRFSEKSLSLAAGANCKVDIRRSSELAPRAVALLTHAGKLSKVEVQYEAQGAARWAIV